MENVQVTVNRESNNFKEFEKIVEEYAVYDMVAEQFMPSFRSQNKLKALQGFKDVANDKNSPINKHADSYQLYLLGTFNEKTGERTNNKQLLATASDLIERSINDQNTNRNS